MKALITCVRPSFSLLLQLYPSSSGVTISNQSCWFLYIRFSYLKQFLYLATRLGTCPYQTLSNSTANLHCQTANFPPTCAAPIIIRAARSQYGPTTAAAGIRSVRTAARITPSSRRSLPPSTPARRPPTNCVRRNPQEKAARRRSCSSASQTNSPSWWGRHAGNGASWVSKEVNEWKDEKVYKGEYMVTEKA